MSRATGFAVVLLVAAASAVIAAAPAGAATDAPRLTAATFSEPPKTARPCYRWWLPLAYTDDAELTKELEQIAAGGAGCVEVSPFGVPGLGNDSADFIKQYGWGTPLWAHRQAVIYKAAARLGLGVDMNLGPNYPPAVPTVHDINDPAAAQQLLYGNTTVDSGSTYDGAAPAPSKSPPSGAETHLIAVVAGKCTKSDCSGGPVMLERATMRDLTGKVDRKDDSISWTAPSGSGKWELISFWQAADGGTKSGMEPNSPNYVVDHLSVRGARALTSFFDASVLQPGELEAIRSGLRSGIFEDSMEMGSNQLWTWDFMSQWRQRRGYEVTKLLPAIANIGAQGTGTPAFDFSDGTGPRLRTDYRQTWSDLYVDRYADTLQDWARGHGMYFRAQSYGDPISTGTAALTLGVPEGESIDFGSPNPHGAEQDFRVLAAAGHLTGQSLISEECCGIFLGAYRSTVAGPDINQEALAATIGANDARNGNLDTIYKGLAGGVTQIVWHGFPYCCAPAGASLTNSGEGGVWPGYNPWSIFGALDVGEMFGPRIPAWDDLHGVNDSLARLQLVLRQGQARPDFAVYYQDLGLPGQSVSPPESPAHMLGVGSDAAKAGYTYEYLAPAMLGRFPGPARYRALVLNNQTTMPVDAARDIVALARKGVPIVVIGDLPTSTPGFDSGGEDAKLTALAKQLLSLKSVKRIASESDLPKTLAGAAVQPGAQFAAATPNLETVRRTTPTADYYFLYNGGSAPVTQKIAFAGRGVPLRLDSWTGDVAPLAQYTDGGGRVTTPVTIAPYDQTVIAVTRAPADLGVRAPAVHALSSTAPQLDYADSELIVRSTSAGTFTTKLSDGRTATSAIPSVPAPMPLTDWTLRAQTWTPGATDHETTKTWQPSAPVIALPGGKLPSWLTILAPVDLHDKAGIGEYTTSVTLPGDWTGGHGAYLDLGEVGDTVQVTVNGHAVPGLDQSSVDRIDVGPYLKTGENTIVVRVATTLFNAVQTNAALGHPGVVYLEQPPQQMGLMGPVQLVPYGRAVVTGDRA